MKGGAYFPILIKRLGADLPVWDCSRTVRWQGLPSNPVDPSQTLEHRRRSSGFRVNSTCQTSEAYFHLEPRRCIVPHPEVN